MDRLIKIRPYPKFFKYLPISNTGFTTLIFKTIYLSQSVYEDINKPNPNPLSIAILKHQEIHAQNASLTKALIYILSKNFRLKEEEKAFTAMFKYLKQYNQTFDLKKVARNFSGIRYLWMTTYREGWNLIQTVWKNA